MSTVKDHRFPVSVGYRSDRTTFVRAPGRLDLRVATPLEFGGHAMGPWTPEDLLVASAASCYTLTLAAVARRRSVPIRSLSVSGMGHVAQRQDRRLGFVAIELDVSLETDEGFVEAAEQAALLAKDVCIVSLALDVPVHVTATVHAAEPAVAV